MSERVFGVTGSTPGNPTRLLTAEVSLERADGHIAKGIGEVLADALTNLAPGATITAMFRRGNEAADVLTSFATLTVSDGESGQTWDFAVGPYQIEPEEVPL